jgi:hypothetical protein
VRALNGWKQDSDLAELSADERAAFTRLWADVAALLTKAEEKGNAGPSAAATPAATRPEPAPPPRKKN